MVQLSFYGGVDEIGGNKILVESKGSRIFLDFGQSFSFGQNFFTGWLSPRAINGLGDYFEFGLLPKFSGLYSADQLARTDLKYTNPTIDGILISHAHFDHVAHLCFVDPKIPVHLGVGTKIFMNSMEATSSFCNYKEHDYRNFRTGDRLKIENFEIEPVHVDHSIAAAYGFIIHSSDATIVYTGDFRLHGPRKDLTEDFIAKAKSSKPDILICEGTRMAIQEKRQNLSEEQVQESANKIVSSTKKIVFTTHYSRDIDRFRSFYNIAKKNNRKIVISPKLAHLLSCLKEDEHLDLPDPLKDPNISIYFKRKRSGKHDDKDYYRWERQFLDKMVTCEYIKKHQRRIIMDLDFYQFGELVDIRPEKGSPFIHSMSEPFSEEDLEDEVMHNWLDHFGLVFHQLHASGHLSKEQIIKVVDEIRANKVFPVHTENAELFKKLNKKVQLPKREKIYRI